MDKFDYFCCYFTQKYSNALELLLRPIVNVSSKGLVKQLNIKYGSEKGQRYDLIYKDNNEKKPLFIYIHGGGFVSGKTTLRRPYCYKIAGEQNYFVANIDYRVAPKYHFHDQMQDVFTAIEKVYDSADKYNIDLTKVVVGGESAGGYFANYLGVLSTHHELFDKLNINFKYKDSFSLKSTVLINGVYNVKTVYHTDALNIKSFIKGFYNLTKKQYEKVDEMDDSLLSSCTYVDSSYPPSVVHRGDKDVFDASTKQLIEIFDERGVEYYLYFATGLSGNHAYTIAPINDVGKDCFNKTFEKVNEYINR